MVRKDEKCVICSSSLDANCAQKPGVLQPEQCPVPSNGECYSRVKQGATVRGCKGGLPSEDESECRGNITCSVTSGSGSNNQIIPNNRLKCFHCDSRVDSTCSEKPTNKSLTLPCKNYVPTESCLRLELGEAGKTSGSI